MATSDSWFSFEGLKAATMHALSSALAVWDRVQARPDLMPKLLSSLLILIITLFVSRWIANGVKRFARRFIQNEAERTLPEFVSQVTQWMILTIGLVAILNQLGVQTASVITVLGAASLAIGLALQGTLGNVASGLVMLFAKPYSIGDSVRVGSLAGRVHRLGLFTTELDTHENVRAFIPNSKVFGEEILNYSTNGVVRVEVVVEVAYESDLEAVLRLVNEIAADQPDRVPFREPWVGLHEFCASGISLRVHLWVPTLRALDARSQLMLAIKSAFDAHNIEIPYPHQIEVSKGA